MPLHHHVERIVPAIDPTCDIVRSNGPLSSKDTRRIFKPPIAVIAARLMTESVCFQFEAAQIIQNRATTLIEIFSTYYSIL